ncbi:MAG: tetratricopeptide repeat-containing glycosyltransferase family protein [Candidatus Babeliales bacterium]
MELRSIITGILLCWCSTLYLYDKITQQAIDYHVHKLQESDTELPSDRLIFDRGCHYTMLGKTDEARECFHKLVRNNPTNISALYNIGYTYKMDGFFEEAKRYFKKTLSLKPSHENAQLALSFALLQEEKFAEGWKEHLRSRNATGKGAPRLQHLLEQHDSLQGKTILIIYEGGLGDTLQFVRYAYYLKLRGAYVIALIQKPLIPLLQRSPFLDEVFPFEGQLPPHDASVSCMALPALLSINATTAIPLMPYLFPSEELITYWKQRIPKTKLAIGISWNSSIYNDKSRPPVAHRSIPLPFFKALASLPHIQLYSLQKDEYAQHDLEEEEWMKSIIHFDDFDTIHGPFMDTAAIISCLDLIISVDTALPHLAGGIGKTTLLLLPYSTDWRWPAHKNSCIWYPSLHLFQQPEPFDWKSVMNEVTKYVQSLVCCTS